LSQFTKKYVLFTQQCSLSSQNMGLGAGIREKPIPDPGVKNALDPGSGSATLVVVLWKAYQNVGFECFFVFFREKYMVPNKLPNRFTYL
jgi:hypothetical protein